jgi:hypothetical protein
MIMRNVFLSILLLTAGISRLCSETVEWSMGTTLDCPVTVATKDQERTRTVVLPTERSIASWSVTSKNNDLRVKQGQRNALILQLYNPVYESNLQIWDEESTLYTLLVRSPAEGELPDDTLIITRSRQGQSQAAGAQAETAKIVNMDTDSSVVHLMAQMTSGITDPKIRSTPHTTVDRGKMTPGKRLPASDDNLTITLLKTYRSPTLFGYECLFEWSGQQSKAFDMQRWWRPGMLAIYATDQSQMRNRDPAMTIGGSRAIRVYYVTDATQGP